MNVRFLVVTSAFALTGCFLNPIGEDPGAAGDSQSILPPSAAETTAPGGTGAPVLGQTPDSQPPPSGPGLGQPGDVNQPGAAPVGTDPTSQPADPILAPDVPGAGGSGAAVGGSPGAGGSAAPAGGVANAGGAGGATAAGGSMNAGGAEPGPGDFDAGTGLSSDEDSGPPVILGGDAGGDAGAP